MLPTSCVIRYGVVTNSTYGIVIFLNVTNGEAPSILAASYRSSGISGMFIRIPETISIVYGIPIHRFTAMIVILAHIGSVKNGSGAEIHPRS